ncbi:MAG TPA: hypothetical protein VFZ41_02100 [Solirubrobacterales bacterium]
MLRRATQTTRGRLVLLLSTVAAFILGSAALDHLVFDSFATYGEALWSATLHLLDPSSLQDDEGAVERTIGIFQVVTGLVLLVGVLFTLVADTVGSSIERLGRVDPPVRDRGHLLVIGGADLLGQAAGALAIAADLGEHRPLVVLAPEDDRPSRNRLLAELREQAGSRKVGLVFGDTAGGSGFQLAAADRAETIVLLPTTSGSLVAEAADVEVMQTGLALKEFLDERSATPQVRLLFRRGRHVDAIWDLFPDGWDAVVGDRVVAATMRVAMTRLEDMPEVGALVDPGGKGDKALLRRARDRADHEKRALRLTIVGCGITAPALMEDLSQAGSDRFQLTMLAERGPFEANLGREDPSGLTLRYRETSIGDPDELERALGDSKPEVVLVTPSPTARDLRTSDAEATLAVLQVLRSLGPETPVLAELFLPESVERLPPDRRLLPVSSLQAVASALALSIADPARSQALVRKLEGKSAAS